MRPARSVVLPSLFALGLAGCAGDRDGKGPELAGSVPYTTVRTDLEIIVPAPGYLEALNSSPVAVPRVPTGALKVKKLVAEGTLVEPGDVLVVFDDTELNIELDNHRATFRSANRRIDRTQLQSTIESGSIEVMREVAELERDHADTFGTLDETIYSQMEILESEVRREEAEETILFADASLLLRGEYYDIEERILGVEKDSVKGKIDRVSMTLGSLVLKAPIGGLVVYRKNWRGSTVAVGDTLWPGNVIMGIVDPSSTALKAFVLEKDVARLESGAPATVTIDARPGEAFEGRLSKVAEVSRPIERGSPVKYSEVIVEITRTGSEILMPGMRGEARLVAGSLTRALVVPRSALRGDPEHPFVLVEGPGGPERRPVTLGPGEAVLVSVEKGLDEGERVLLGGSVADVAPDHAASEQGTPATGA